MPISITHEWLDSSVDSVDIAYWRDPIPKLSLAELEKFVEKADGEEVMEGATEAKDSESSPPPPRTSFKSEDKNKSSLK